MGSFFLSARAATLAARAYETLAAKAYTPEEAALREGAAELARAFAVEWATWSGDREEYAARLARFVGKDAAGRAQLPQGVQQVASASVISLRRDGQDAWTASVLLHVRRAVKPPSGSAGVPPELVAARAQGTAPPGGGQPQETVSVWRDAVLLVEVPVRAVGGRLAVAGLPALAPAEPPPEGRQEGAAAKLSAAPDQAFQTFLRQFLDFYYRGEDVRNFVAEGSGIRPLGGWNLAEIREVKADDQANPKLVLVECAVSAPGTASVTQRLLLEVSSSGGKYLVRAVKPAPLN